MNVKKKILKYIFKKEEAWSYVETLIVIAIILILTATVGIMAIKNLEKARVAGAQTQIESFCTALEAYYIDNGVYPSTEQGFSALRKEPGTFPIPKNWDGPYLLKDAPKDPWGNDYEYLRPGPDGYDYGIRSFGADGIEGGEGKDSDITSWN